MLEVHWVVPFLSTILRILEVRLNCLNGKCYNESLLGLLHFEDEKALNLVSLVVTRGP